MNHFRCSGLTIDFATATLQWKPASYHRQYDVRFRQLCWWLSNIQCIINQCIIPQSGNVLQTRTTFYCYNGQLVFSIIVSRYCNRHVPQTVTRREIKMLSQLRYHEKFHKNKKELRNITKYSSEVSEKKNWEVLKDNFQKLTKKIEKCLKLVFRRGL